MGYMYIYAMYMSVYIDIDGIYMRVYWHKTNILDIYGNGGGVCYKYIYVMQMSVNIDIHGTYDQHSVYMTWYICHGAKYEVKE